MTANFWKSRISAYLNDYQAAYNYDKLTNKNQNKVIENLLTESLATYQRDYYRTQLESSEYKIKTRKVK